MCLLASACVLEVPGGGCEPPRAPWPARAMSGKGGGGMPCAEGIIIILEEAACGLSRRETSPIRATVALPKGRQRVRRPRDGECERLRGDDGSHGVRVKQRAGSVKESSRCKGDGVCNCKVKTRSRNLWLNCTDILFQICQIP